MTLDAPVVACSSATSCVAVGANGVVMPIASGVAGPVDVVPGVETFWNVSCGGPTSCLATATSTAGEGLVVPVTGGVAGPAQSVAGVRTDVIACQSEGSCLATAIDSSFHSYIVSITGGIPGPAQLVSSAMVGLGSIACTDASHCVAVGDTLGFDNVGAVVAVDDGVPGPLQTVPGTNLFRSVACTTSCVAVGVLNVEAPPQLGAIVPISGGVAGSAQYASGTGYLYEVLCDASGCRTVGQDPSGSEQIPLTAPDTGLTVNAIHLSVNGGGLAHTNLVVGSAESDVDNCP